MRERYLIEYCHIELRTLRYIHTLHSLYSDHIILVYYAIYGIFTHTFTQSGYNKFMCFGTVRTCTIINSQNLLFCRIEYIASKVNAISNQFVCMHLCVWFGHSFSFKFVVFCLYVRQTTHSFKAIIIIIIRFIKKRTRLTLKIGIYSLFNKQQHEMWTHKQFYLQKNLQIQVKIKRAHSFLFQYTPTKMIRAHWMFTVSFHRFIDNFWLMLKILCSSSRAA